MRQGTRRLATAFAAAALLLAGCGDAGDTTTTTADGPPVSFGEGEIPPGVPDDFPFPPQAVIGSTLVDRNNGRIEVEFRVRAAAVELVAFYDQALPAAGYEITATVEGDPLTTLEFAHPGGLEGKVVISFVDAGLARAVAEFVGI
jgi:hypothetical protein